MPTPFRRQPSGIYHIRIAIPPELRALYQTPGKNPPPERLVSLKTRNKTQADVAAARAVLKYKDEFEAKRWELRPRAALRQDDLHAAAWGTYQRLDAADDDLRLNPPSLADLPEARKVLEREFPDDKAKVNAILKEIEVALRDPAAARWERDAAIKAEVGRYGDATVREDVADFVREHHIDAEPGSVSWKRIANAIQRGEREANRAADRRDEGEPVDIRDKLVSEPAVPRAKPGEEIMELFEAFARENPRGNVKDSINTSRRDVALFVSTLPPRSSVKAITRRAVADWKALLVQWPVKATETTEFRGMSMAEVVERNKDVKKPKIAVRTINRHLSALSAFCDWLLANDHIQTSPATRMQLTDKRKVGDGKPFPLTDLPKIFAAPLFVGAESDTKMRKPGDVLIRDYRYWTPLVMLFSGARPGELAQMLVEDVRLAHGRWIMHITTENDEDKSLKTDNSHRVVPVHPELERLGFLDHVKKMRKAGERKVFPDAKQNKRGQWGVDFSSSFSDLLTDVGVKTKTGPSKRLTLYSFRHSVSDALRLAGFDDAEFAPLYGHSKATTTARYGHEQPRTIEQRAKMIDAIAYEGLDLSHLHAGG